MLLVPTAPLLIVAGLTILPTAVVFLPVLVRAAVFKLESGGSRDLGSSCITPYRCYYRGRDEQPLYPIELQATAGIRRIFQPSATREVTVVLQWRPGRSGPKHH